MAVVAEKTSALGACCFTSDAQSGWQVNTFRLAFAAKEVASSPLAIITLATLALETIVNLESMSRMRSERHNVLNRKDGLRLRSKLFMRYLCANSTKMRTVPIQREVGFLNI